MLLRQFSSVLNMIRLRHSHRAIRTGLPIRSRNGSTPALKNDAKLTGWLCKSDRIWTVRPSRRNIWLQAEFEQIKPRQETPMALRKFIIERDIPQVGSLEREQL